jgi:hypothetical protein
MPLIRKEPDKATATASRQALPSLASASADERWAAARARRDPDAVPALSEALAYERDARVREAIFTALARIGTLEGAKAVLPYLRLDDANTRTGAMDAVRAMPDACQPLLPGLLEDPDPDVRLLACDLVRDAGGAGGSRWLCALIELSRRLMFARPRWKLWARSEMQTPRRRSHVAPSIFWTIRSSGSPSKSSLTACAASRRRLVVESTLLGRRGISSAVRLFVSSYRHGFHGGQTLFRGTTRKTG